MNMQAKVFPIFILLLIISSFPCLVSSEEQANYELNFSMKLVNKGESIYFLSEDDKSFLFSANDTWQILRLKKSSHPIIRTELDEDGNLVAILDLPPSLNPGESISINLSYSLVLTPREVPDLSLDKGGKLEDIPTNLREKYTKPTSLWMYDNWTEIRELAHHLSANETNVLKIVYTFINWIFNNVKYKVGDLPKHPNETYLRREGDCDDQANLLITLSRAVGIPAYLKIGGIPIPHRFSSYTFDHLTVTEIGIGFHGWAVLYIPPWGWVHVDLTWGIDKKDPSTAITRSAFVKAMAFHFYDIVSSDYASKMKEFHERLKVNSLFIEELISIKDVQKGMIAIERNLMIYGSIAGLVLTLIVLVVIYIVARRRAISPS